MVEEEEVAVKEEEAEDEDDDNVRNSEDGERYTLGDVAVTREDGDDDVVVWFITISIVLRLSQR